MEMANVTRHQPAGGGRCVLRPTSKRKHTWDLVCCLLIAFDVFCAPLQVFDPPLRRATRILGWIACVYWSLDLFLQFFVGFICTKSGVLENRLPQIWRHYLRGWFCFDLSAVVFEYSASFLDTSNHGADSVVSVVRFLRFAWLIRVLKLRKKYEKPPRFAGFEF